MIHRGYSISFNKLKKYILGYLVNDAFFFFKVKYIEKKCSIVGVYWPIYFRVFTVLSVL